MRRGSFKIGASDGFTIVELMMVVLIIGVLVSIATPVFFASRARARKLSCFANQRTLEGAATTWQAVDPASHAIANLAGVVNASHPLVLGGQIVRAPRCPSAPAPADPNNPTAAEGAYTFDTEGSVDACTFGELAAHGHY